MIVLDASAAVDLLLRQRHWQAIATLVAEHEVVSAELLPIEVLQVLRRFEHRGELPTDRAAQAVQDLIDLPVTLQPHGPITPAVWSLRAEITAYDAAYVVLAQALEALLVTTDQRLATTAARHCQVAAL